MQTIRFNTGRQYSDNGQTIVATLHDDNVITFYDHDRMISGELTLWFFIEEGPFHSGYVMAEYDKGHYMGSARAQQDAFGINNL